MGRHPLLILTTAGQRTDRLFSTPVIGIADGDDYLVVASNGGAATQPMRVRNIAASPHVTIRRGTLAQERRARLLAPAERAQCWPRLVGAYQPHATMQARTDRELPVVRLGRAGGASSPDKWLTLTPAGWQDDAMASSATGLPGEGGPGAVAGFPALGALVARMQAQLAGFRESRDPRRFFHTTYLRTTQAAGAELAAAGSSTRPGSSDGTSRSLSSTWTRWTPISVPLTYPARGLPRSLRRMIRPACCRRCGTFCWA